jgi:Carbamoyl-phosphate synthase small chain, CPSase domain
MTGFLALEDCSVFRGESVGAEGFAFGEAVFTTSMTGYQEVVTDPSYAEQLVVFTDDRQLRRRRRSVRVHAAACARGGDARGARPCLD